MPVLIATGLGALLLVWLVVRVSMGNALLESRSGVVTRFASWHPGTVLEPLGDALEADREIGEEAQAAGLEALGRAPLAVEPLLLAARRATVEGDQERADRLIEKAHRQNPRSRYALLLHLERELRQNRLNEAALTMAVLSRLMPNSGDVLVGQLAKMAQYPETAQAIRGVIQEHPELRASLLEQLARQGADADLILSLAGSGARTGAAEVPRWQTLLLDSLVERGEVARARRIWSDLSGVEAPTAGVYDPGFTGLPGPAPFNWQFESSSDGVAEISSGSPGLYVEYYARRDARLGEQLITLPPGRYRMSFQAEGETKPEGGEIAWTISCHPRSRRIGRVPITDIGSSPKTISGTFAVPAGCSAQWLRLTGKFAEFPSNQQATIRDLRIARLGPS